jgi:hypothetical protein
MPLHYSIGDAAIVRAGTYPRTTILHLTCDRSRGKWPTISSAQVYDLPAIDRQLRKGSRVLRYQSTTSDFNGCCLVLNALQPHHLQFLSYCRVKR